MKQYDEQELKRLCECVGWGLTRDRLGWWDVGCGKYASLNGVARRLADRLEELAKQSDNATTVRNRIYKYQLGHSKKAVSLRKEAASLRAWADEQDKPKEPTILERLKEVKRRTDRPVTVAIGTLADALIELYERKE